MLHPELLELMYILHQDAVQADLLQTYKYDCTDCTRVLGRAVVTIVMKYGLLGE